MWSPLVSVIIPNYNHAKYLDQRIQSVLNQSYQNFEIIILDDKSIDNSYEIIEKYRSNSLVRSIVYNENNSGSTFIQWRRGIELANGDLIWIAESDDYCTENFLERSVEAFVGTPNCSIAFVASQIVYENGHVINQHLKCKEPYESFDGSRFIVTSMLTSNTIWNASAVVFSKKKALSADRRFTNYKAAGDRLFWIEMAELGRVAIIPNVHNFFRQHEENKVSNTSLSNGITFIEQYDIFKYLIGHKHLTGFEIIDNLYYYMSKIYSATFFENEEVRNSVLNKWSIIPFCPKLTYLLCRSILKLRNIFLKQN